MIRIQLERYIVALSHVPRPNRLPLGRLCLLFINPHIRGNNMSLAGILVFESAVDLKMYKVAPEPTMLVIDSAKATILQSDSTTMLAVEHPQWDIIKDRLIPV